MNLIKKQNICPKFYMNGAYEHKFCSFFISKSKDKILNLIE